MTGSVSVVIPVYGTAPHLQRCIAALHAQSRLPSEVLVFHSGPGAPPEPLRRASPDIRVYHAEERHFAGHARNAGAARASGDLLIFVDSDIIADPGFVEAICAELSTHPDSVLIGSVGLFPAGGLWARVAWFIEFGSVFPSRSAHSPQSAPSACFGLNRSVFEGSGGFRTDLFAAEDGDFFVRLQAGGHALRFVPNARCDHVFAGGARKTLARLGELGRAAAFLRRTHDLPGSAAVRHPILAGLLPLARMGQMALRLLVERGPVGHFLLISPAIFVGLCAWALGFYREARRPTYPSPDATGG